MKENKEAIISITYILSGSLLLVFNELEEGWLGKILVVAGYIFYFIGLNKLIMGLDEKGKAGAKNLKTGIIIGIVGIIIDFIPIIGVISVVFYLASFIFQLMGLLKLKKSKSTGVEGVKGINYILIAVIIGILQGILSLIPFAGKQLVFLVAVFYIIFIIIGWINIQRGIFTTSIKSKLD